MFSPPGKFHRLIGSMAESSLGRRKKAPSRELGVFGVYKICRAYRQDADVTDADVMAGLTTRAASVPDDLRVGQTFRDNPACCGG